MKNHTKKFLLYFICIFIIIIAFGIIFSPSDLVFEGIIRALIISSAGNLDLFLEDILFRKSKVEILKKCEKI